MRDVSRRAFLEYSVTYALPILWRRAATVSEPENDAIMLIPDEGLDDFIDRYERAYGDRLSREAARPIATGLVDLYRLITQPLPVNPTDLDLSDPQAA